MRKGPICEGKDEGSKRAMRFREMQRQVGPFRERQLSYNEGAKHERNMNERSQKIFLRHWVPHMASTRRHGDTDPLAFLTVD